MQRYWQKDFVMDVVSQRIVSGGLRSAFLVYMPGIAPSIALENQLCLHLVTETTVKALALTVFSYWKPI